jgi:hypothetical protein
MPSNTASTLAPNHSGIPHAEAGHGQRGRHEGQHRRHQPHEPQALTGTGLTVILVGVLLPMIDFFIVNVA